MANKVDPDQTAAVHAFGITKQNESVDYKPNSTTTTADNIFSCFWAGGQSAKVKLLISKKKERKRKQITMSPEFKMNYSKSNLAF